MLANRRRKQDYAVVVGTSMLGIVEVIKSWLEGVLQATGDYSELLGKSRGAGI